MLKIIVINTILILLTITRLNSQTIKIYYKTLFNNQTLSENFEPSYYLGTENNSIFVYGKDTSDLKDKYPYGGLITIISDSIGNVFYKDYTKQLYIYKEIVPLRIVSTDTLHNIEWEIINGSKEILNYNCKQATGMYSGRKYIAWFTEEIPIPSGPNRYCGLPGLILELEYEGSIKKTTLKSIEFNPEIKILDISEGVVLEDKRDLVYYIHNNSRKVKKAIKKQSKKVRVCLANYVEIKRNK